MNPISIKRINILWPTMVRVCSGRKGAINFARIKTVTLAICLITTNEQRRFYREREGERLSSLMFLGPAEKHLPEEILFCRTFRLSVTLEDDYALFWYGVPVVQ